MLCSSVTVFYLFHFPRFDTCIYKCGPFGISIQIVWPSRRFKLASLVVDHLIHHLAGKMKESISRRWSLQLPMRNDVQQWF